jgi:hypothetical protein
MGIVGSSSFIVNSSYLLHYLMQHMVEELYSHHFRQDRGRVAPPRMFSRPTENVGLSLFLIPFHYSTQHGVWENSPFTIFDATGRE